MFWYLKSFVKIDINVFIKVVIIVFENILVDIYLL